MARATPAPLREWLRVKRNHGCLDETLRRYAELVRSALQFLRSRRRPTHPRRWTEHDWTYLRDRVARNRWSFGIIVDFAKFSGNRTFHSVTPPIRRTSGRVRWLTRDQVEALLRATRREPILSIIALLGLGQGLRRVEWKRLTMDDVDLSGGRLLVRGKGRGSPKLVWMALHPAFPAIWRQWTEERTRLVEVARKRFPGSTVPTEALIHVARSGLSAYSASGLDQQVQRIAARMSLVGVEVRLSSHMLRRSGATLLEEALLASPRPTMDGVYRAVQSFLRHEDLATTMKYLQGNPIRQRRAMVEFDRSLSWDP